MSLSVLVTNLSTAKVSIDDAYVTLGATGSANDHVTLTRSMAELDSMQSLKTLLNAGTISVAVTASSDNADILSIPVEQHGSVAISVASATVVVASVAFGSAFVAVPTIDVAIGGTATMTFKAQAYAQAVTTSGFDIALDVTTAQTGIISGENPTVSPAENSPITQSLENPVMSPAENGSALGAFTSTLAHAPLGTGVLTLHWLESAVAKTATITGTTTLGGANSANLSAASIDRTTGALSITFAGGHPPDTDSITVDYPYQGVLGPYTMTLAYVPVTAAAITVHWNEATVGKTATITGTSTLGGANSANLTSATLNRTTGLLSLTFLTNHAPDTNSITVDYVQTENAIVSWIASY